MKSFAINFWMSFALLSGLFCTAIGSFYNLLMAFIFILIFIVFIIIIIHFVKYLRTCADPEIFMRGGPTKIVIFGHRRGGVQPPQNTEITFFLGKIFKFQVGGGGRTPGPPSGSAHEETARYRKLYQQINSPTNVGRAATVNRTMGHLR